MTPNEKRIIAAARRCFEADYRYARWSGTGATRQAQAVAARDAAYAAWELLMDELHQGEGDA